MLIVAGKVLSFLRDIAVSYHFGSDKTTDAYFAANNVPSILFTAIISSYLVLLIPTYKKIQMLYGNHEGDIFASSLVNFFVFLSIILTTIGYIFIDYLILLVSPGFDHDTHKLAVKLGKILVLSFPMSAIVIILATISNANKNFYALHIIPLISSIIVIISLSLFAQQFGIYALALSGVLAYAVQFVIQVYVSKQHFSYRFNTSPFNSDIKKMTILALPIIVSYSIDQVNLLVNSVFASKLADGSLSSLIYAQKLQATFVGVISMAVLTVIYPLLSELVAKNDVKHLTDIIHKSLKGIIIVVIPIALFLSLNSEIVVNIIYLRGKFEIEDSLNTSQIFLFYAINILFLSIREMVLRVFYLHNSTKRPLVASLISVLINIVLSFILVPLWGVKALSFANLVATIISLLLLYYYLKIDKIISFADMHFLKFFRNCSLAILAFILSQKIIENISIVQNKYFLLICLTFSFIVYYYSLLLLNQEEAIFIRRKISDIIKKRLP